MEAEQIKYTAFIVRTDDHTNMVTSRPYRQIPEVFDDLIRTSEEWLRESRTVRSVKIQVIVDGPGI